MRKNQLQTASRQTVCVRRLIFKPRQNVRVTLLIDATSQRFPLMDVLRGAFRAFVCES